MADNDRGGASFIEGLLLGGILGGIIGLLFAPQAGEKTRTWLKNLKDDNQDIIDSALNTSENLITSSKQAITDGFDKVAKMIEDKLESKKKPLK